MKYQQGKIYKIVNDIDNEIYVGSTCQTLSKRMAAHRGYAQTFNTPVYKHMRAIGIDNFRIILVEECPCRNKDQLRAREEYWRKELKATLNKLAAFTSYEDKLIQKNEYYHKHRDYFIDLKREYNKANKKEINRKNRDYHKKNKEKIAEQQHQIELCDCGLTHTHQHRLRHLRSEQHRWYKEMNQNPDQTEYLLCDCGMYIKEEVWKKSHLKSKLHRQRMELLEEIEL